MKIGQKMCTLIDLKLCEVLYEIIHICTAVIDESEE